MSFSNHKDIGEVLQEFQVTYIEAHFMEETEFNVPDHFRKDLQFMMREAVVDNLEFAICENLIYPILKQVWKIYYSKFVLWSHKSLTYNLNLSDFPEYILAKRSPLGKFVFGKPYFLLVEAKQDKFDEGWAQCLTEMVAAQKLNDELKVTIFGIVSNGKGWEFGKLDSRSCFYRIALYVWGKIDCSRSNSLFLAANSC